MRSWVDSIRRYLHLMGIPNRLGLCYERTNVRTNERITCVTHKPYVPERARRGHKMSPEDAGQVVELAAALWPNVKDTQATRQVWSMALAHTDLYDAKDALGSLARERKTAHVSDIVKRAAAMREALLRSLPPIPDPPVELADNPTAEMHWIRVARERQLSQARLERHAVLA